MDKVKNLGQVFTPTNVVEYMLSLRENNGNILEPSSGDGAFSDIIDNIVAIEIDKDNKTDNNIIMDFFDYDTINKFDTIIGNPPYVAFKNISSDTLQKIQSKDYLSNFDNRTNLYLYFIRKCIEHLNDNGEIIFITPREFIKTTSAIKLNTLLYEKGTITEWFEYGDEVVFKGYSPTVVVWRFEKDNFSRKTKTNNGYKTFKLNDGQISFISNEYNIKFSDLFSVKVGAVSGMDAVFTHEDGNKEFVCSYTKQKGKLKKMYYNVRNEYIDSKKEILMTRKLKKFTENNWWMWGRGFYESDSDRIYVNCKTRSDNPFFLNDCNNYDGSVLAIFPKKEMSILKVKEMLNNVDWVELGFKVGGRFCFTQKSLENTYLPKTFDIFK